MKRLGGAQPWIRGALAVVVLGAAARLAAGCGLPEEGPMMQPGVDCMQCHNNWTVAGTAYAAPDADRGSGLEGAEILVIDADGNELTLKTNGAGNFYTAEPLTFPIHVHARMDSSETSMLHSTSNGACNSCHRQPPYSDAPGRVYVP